VSVPVERPVIGVLALQGDVREHLAALTALGAEPRAVRRPGELAGVSGLVIPGGESTTMVKLADRTGLLGPLRAAVRAGLPAYGSCAGLANTSVRAMATAMVARARGSSPSR
jgi:pyridoxal 5'-phosphate synthase pdxT subunit